MNKKIFKIAAFGLLAATPAVALAAQTLRDIVAIFIGYLSVALTLIISLAVVTFIWNIYKYFFMADAKRDEAGKYVLYSVIGFFVIFSFWGLVAIVSNSLNLPQNTMPWPFGGGSTVQQMGKWSDPVPGASTNKNTTGFSTPMQGASPR